MKVGELQVGGHLHAAAFRGQDELVVSGHDAGLRVVSASTGATLARLRQRGTSRLATSPDGRLALVADSGRGVVQAYDLDARAFKGELELPDGIAALAWPAGREALIATGGGLFLVDLRDLSRWRRLRAGNFRAATLAPADAFVAAASWGGRVVQLLDLAGAPSVELQVGARVESLAVAPDGDLVAVGDRAGDVHLLSRDAGREVARLDGHGAPVWTVAFNPRVRRLASAARDGTLRLWDLPTRRLVCALDAHRGDVTSCAWSSDGARLVTTGVDGWVRTWSLGP